MSPKRGDRVAPPPGEGEFDLRFANGDAAKGWEELCRQAPGNARTAFEAIRGNPCPSPVTQRNHRLKHTLAWGTHNGRSFEQWQYEVTGDGRIWYLVDQVNRTVWLVYAGTGHPKATDSQAGPGEARPAGRFGSGRWHPGTDVTGRGGTMAM